MIRYPTFLLKNLKQLKIPIVFSSWKKLKLPNFDSKIRFMNLPQLSIEQRGTLSWKK
jgi:hypothetical protein